MVTRKKATPTRKSSKSSKRVQKDAIALLKEGHEKVRGLLSQLEKSTERAASRREQLLAKIETEIKIHTQIEEEIFYPAFRNAARKKDDTEIFLEAKEEHHVVDMVMPELKNTEPTAEEFGAKAKVLKDLIEHHAEEEETEMFPRARKLMDRDELRELGAMLQSRKEELSGKM